MQPDYSNYDYTAINIEREAQNRRKLLITFLAILGLLIVAAIIWSQILNKVTVTLDPTSNTTISIGTVGEDERGGGIQKVLAISSTKKTVRLSKGDYIVRYQGKNLQEKSQSVTLENNVSFKTPELDYISTYLDTLLSTERNAIQARLNPSLKSGYAPEQEKLYDRGQWYTAQLIPNDMSTEDKLVVVMHKEDNTWKVVAGPSIVLWLGDYKNIPADIIRTVNNQQVAIPTPAS